MPDQAWVEKNICVICGQAKPSSDAEKLLRDAAATCGFSHVNICECSFLQVIAPEVAKNARNNNRQAIEKLLARQFDPGSVKANLDTVQLADIDTADKWLEFVKAW